MTTPRLRSLFECLGAEPESRPARGKRSARNPLLARAVAARLAGYRGVNAFAQCAALLSPEQLQTVGAFWHPSRPRSTPPALTPFHNLRAARPPQPLANALGQRAGQPSSAPAPVALGRTGSARRLAAAFGAQLPGGLALAQALECVLRRGVINANTAIRAAAQRVELPGSAAFWVCDATTGEARRGAQGRTRRELRPITGRNNDPITPNHSLTCI